MKNRYKKINISDFPTGKFDGYYWFSDQPKPEIIIDKEIDRAKFQKLPFVVEANFYSKETHQSIQVKNIDGKYLCAQIDLTDCKSIPQTYIGHDIGGKNFLLVEAWEEKTDELLEGMTTKIPSWSAFRGFVEHNNSNDND
jgi:CRISPR type III-associated protein (TIGR04423 family)